MCYFHCMRLEHISEKRKKKNRTKRKSNERKKDKFHFLNKVKSSTKKNKTQ